MTFIMSLHLWFHFTRAECMIQSVLMVVFLLTYLQEFEGEDFNACRVHGSIEVNKVAGNFHFTAGKSIPHPRGHAHLSSLVSELNYNFSHRIDLLSFGTPHPGILNPLDGDLMITKNAYHMYQYYIKIVPTNVSISCRIVM